MKSFNITLGVPIIRTSVDHGTALEIAGKLKPKLGSIKEAFKQGRNAAQMNDRKHRRKLGQNYLIDPVILFEMERSINPQENNFFFEIGPGTGALTEYLRGEKIKIIAMDLDLQNIHKLEKKFLHPNHEFIHGDVLNESLDFLSHGKYRLAGNLPYNISTQIIMKLIKFYENIHDMHFLVQREVALRICALNGSR